MNTSIYKSTLLVLLAGVSLLAGIAKAEDGIVKNAYGDYVVTITDRNGVARRELFIPATKIDPAVRSLWHLSDKVITYRYRVHNGSLAKQHLNLFIVEPVTGLITTPPVISKQANRRDYVLTLIKASKNSIQNPSGGWDGDIIDIPAGFRLGWGNASQDPALPSGLAPGTGASGFGYQSADLPGIAIMELRGDVTYTDDTYSQYDDPEMIDMQTPVGDQYQQMQNNDFVPRYVAAAMIAVPVPFDAAVLLDRIRSQVATWPSKQLVDATFAAQLDRYLLASVDAYRLNNAKVGKEHIEAIRKMLEKEHHYLDKEDLDDEDNEEHKTATRFTIDRLAARVLDFDLKYVLKRMKKDDEHEHDRGDKEK